MLTIICFTFTGLCHFLLIVFLAWRTKPVATIRLLVFGLVLLFKNNRIEKITDLCAMFF